MPWKRSLGGVMLIAWALDLSAQKPIAIPSAPTCAKCAVQLSTVARLGGADDPASTGLMPEVVRTGRGQFLVSSSTFLGEIFVYDRSGKFVRSIGRRGGGPGEFNAVPKLTVDATDTVRAIESGTRYHVVAPDLAIKRTIPLVVSLSAAVAESDGRLFAVTPSTSGPNATTLGVFDRAGKRVQAFGKLPTGVDAEMRFRRLAIGPQGSRWGISTAAYVIERWLPDGSLAQQLTAERDWLKKSNDPAGDARLRKPPARLLGLLVDAQERLFVFAIVADAEWKPVAATPSAEPNQVFDTLIEVIDPRTGKLIARTRLDQFLVPMHGTLAYSTFEDDTGDRRIQVWNVSLLHR